LKFIQNKVYKYCHKHPRFGIRNLMLYVSVLTAVVMFIQWFDPSGGRAYEILCLDPQRIFKHGEVWRLVTWIFLDAGFPVLTGGGAPIPITVYGMFVDVLILIFYYRIGATLEREWGSGRFTIFYLSGVWLTLIYSLITGLPAHISYINLSLFFAYATMFPDLRILLFYVIPIKIKWLAIANAVFFVGSFILMLMARQFIEAFLPVIAIANYLLLCGLPGVRFAQAKAKSNVVNFKSAVKSAQKTMPYRHKCEVCGKTDISDPQTQFRYCSRCEGFHCYCEEHIESHTHK